MVSSAERHNDYDAFARGYTQDNDSNATNAYYERPASLALLGDVAGQRVLDAGCGAGSHAAEMIRRGASVTGLDKSGGLLAIARERLGADVPLHAADLADPLPLATASFDAILASLVLHYLQDWGPTLAEFRRVLVPGGRLVISTHHPFMDHPLAGGPDYFATYDFTEEWTKGGQTMLMRFWHRPLHAMTDAFQAAGFTLDALAEPRPDPAAEARFPSVYADLLTNPRFLFFRLIAPLETLPRLRAAEVSLGPAPLVIVCMRTRKTGAVYTR
jgi:SAM-dependent methyltransferase